jgi:hypothetical protein
MDPDRFTGLTVGQEAIYGLPRGHSVVLAFDLPIADQSIGRSPVSKVERLTGRHASRCSLNPERTTARTMLATPRGVFAGFQMSSKNSERGSPQNEHRTQHTRHFRSDRKLLILNRMEWCREGGSNPHDRKGRRILSPLRLPVPPSRLGGLQPAVSHGLARGVITLVGIPESSWSGGTVFSRLQPCDNGT